MLVYDIMNLSLKNREMGEGWFRFLEEFNDSNLNFPNTIYIFYRGDFQQIFIFKEIKKVTILYKKIGTEGITTDYQDERIYMNKLTSNDIKNLIRTELGEEIINLPKYMFMNTREFNNDISKLEKCKDVNGNDCYKGYFYHNKKTILVYISNEKIYLPFDNVTVNIENNNICEAIDIALTMI